MILAKKKAASPRTATDVDRHVGRIVRERRIAMNISQAALAKAAGVTFQQIQKYESGANRIAASTLFTICDALGMPVSAVVPDAHDGAKTADELAPFAPLLMRLNPHGIEVATEVLRVLAASPHLKN